MTLLNIDLVGTSAKATYFFCFVKEDLVNLGSLIENVEKLFL